MTITDETVLIPATAEEVFDYLDDPAHLPEFDATILSAELEGGGPMQVGSRIKGVSKILGKTFTWTVEVIEHEWPKRLVVKSVEGQIQYTAAYTLTTEAEGTRVRYRNEAAGGLDAVFGDTPEADLSDVGSRQMRTSLGALSEILAGQRQSSETA